MLKRFALALLAAVCLCGGAVADPLWQVAINRMYNPAGPGHLGIGGHALGPNIFASPASIAYPSVLFDQANAVNVGVVNAGLKTNGTAPGAFYVPATVTSSWFAVIVGQINPALSIYYPALYETLASGQAANAGTGCSAATCTGGSDHYLRIAPAGPNTAEMQFLLQSSRAANKFWTGGSVVSAGYTAGSGYNNGFFAWTATGTSCTVAPAGVVLVGASTSGQVYQVRVTNPGQGCPTSGTSVVTASMAAGLGGTGTNTIATLTFGYGTGVAAPAPGTQFCAVVGQFGSSDAPAGLQNMPFLAVVDSSGAEFANSPAVSATSNASYYASTTQAAIGDLFNFFGSAYAGSTAANEYGWGGAIESAGMVWGVYPNTGTAPNDAMLQNICKKAVDPYAYLSANFTLHSWFQFGQSYSDKTGANGAAVAVGTVETGAASAPGSALTLKPWDAYTIFPVLNASGGVAPPLTGSGSIPLAGTVNPALFGGPVNRIVAQLSSSPSSCVAVSGYAPGCAWVQPSAQAVTGSTWAATLTGVPAGGPYYVTVANLNTPGYTVQGNPAQVGIVTILVGQSQVNTMGINSYTGNDLALAPGENHTTASALEIYQTITPSYLPELSFANYSTYSLFAQRRLDASSIASTSANLEADGFVGYQMALGRLAAAAWTTCGVACPVALVDLANPGKQVAIWTNGYVAQSGTLAGSGAGPYTATASFAELSLGLTGAVAIASALPAYTVLAGSMNVYVGGVLAATDGATGDLGVNSSTICAGQNGFTVSACSINYLNGAVSITFGASTSSAVTIGWTNIIDLAPAAQGAQTQAPHMTASTGLATVRPLERFRLLGHAESRRRQSDRRRAVHGGRIQFHVELSGGGYVAFRTMVLVLGTRFPALFPQIASNTPVMWWGHMRDNYFPTIYTNGYQINGCLQQSIDFVTGATSSTLKYSGAGAIGSGGSQQDGALYAEVMNADNPHPGRGTYGGQRYARRAALEAWALLSNQPALAAEPTISAAAFDNTSTYNAACSTTHYHCINVTVALNATGATALKTCGPNLAGGAYPAAGACSDAGIGQQVAGFRIGSVAAQSYALGSFFGDGFDPYAVKYTRASGLAARRSPRPSCNASSRDPASGPAARPMSPMATRRSRSTRAR